MSDNTKRIIFVVLAVILLLSVILPLVVARFEEQKAALSTGTIKALWWVLRIIRLLISITLTLWLMLFLCIDWIRNRIDNIERATKLRIVVLVLWWLTITILVLLGIKFLIVLYRGSHRIVFASIEYVLLSLLFGCFLLYLWQWLQYFHTQPLHKIVVACLLEQHDKFVKANKLDKAYAALLKTCETAPDGLWLWCRLALFCERTRKNSAEADKYMTKAEELITTTKANSISDKACYLDYLGLINYVRGECDKGLTYIKQAIDIEPKPFRTKMYEELLSDSKTRQQGPGNNTG